MAAKLSNRILHIQTAPGEMRRTLCGKSRRLLSSFQAAQALADRSGWCPACLRKAGLPAPAAGPRYPATSTGREAELLRRLRRALGLLEAAQKTLDGAADLAARSASLDRTWGMLGSVHHFRTQVRELLEHDRGEAGFRPFVASLGPRA